jgi:RNA polymerase sigma-70 factor (ECF subfamily)
MGRCRSPIVTGVVSALARVSGLLAIRSAMLPVELRRLVEAGRPDEAVAALYAAHAVEVQRFVRARLGPGVDPADVCQEVWASALRALPGFRFESQPRVWLLSIARHKTLDAWRGRQTFDSLDSQIGGGGPLGSLLGQRTALTPTGELDRRQRADALHQALRQLDPEQRELLELRYVFGLKPAEIAEILEAPGGNAVSQRIVRAAQRLRQILQQQERFR